MTKPSLSDLYWTEQAARVTTKALLDTTPEYPAMLSKALHIALTGAAKRELIANANYRRRWKKASQEERDIVNSGILKEHAL